MLVKTLFVRDRLKKVLKNMLFFLDNTCACVLGPRKGCPWPRIFLCPWPRIFLYPWPWLRALRSRLHLCLQTDARRKKKKGIKEKKAALASKLFCSHA